MAGNLAYFCLPLYVYQHGKSLFLSEKYRLQNSTVSFLYKIYKKTQNICMGVM